MLVNPARVCTVCTFASGAVRAMRLVRTVRAMRACTLSFSPHFALRCSDDTLHASSLACA
eukprot:3078140-Pleurochrysis_carterae.AAC.2